MTKFKHTNPHHCALLRAAITTYRKQVPTDAAPAYAADLRKEGRDADAEVLIAYTEQERAQTARPSLFKSRTAKQDAPVPRKSEPDEDGPTALQREIWAQFPSLRNELE